jgi:hypothetical protein
MQLWRLAVLYVNYSFDIRRLKVNLTFFPYLTLETQLSIFKIYKNQKHMLTFFLYATALKGPKPPHCWGFEIIFRHTTLSKTPLEEVWAHSRDLYLTTHNIQTRHKSLTPVGFEPAIPTSEQPQTYCLDSVTFGIRTFLTFRRKIWFAGTWNVQVMYFFMLLVSSIADIY